jgi:hypothetical protein
MLCFEVPLFSFAMLVTELAHKLLKALRLVLKLDYKLTKPNHTN